MSSQHAFYMSIFLCSVLLGCATTEKPREMSSEQIEKPPQEAASREPAPADTERRASPRLSRPTTRHDSEAARSGPPLPRSEPPVGASTPPPPETPKRTPEPNTPGGGSAPDDPDALEHEGDSLTRPGEATENAAPSESAPSPPPGATSPTTPASSRTADARADESSPAGGPAVDRIALPRGPDAPQRAPAFLLAVESRSSRTELPVEVPDLQAECEVKGQAEIDGLRLSLLRYAPSVSIRERILPAPRGETGFLALHLTLEAVGQRHETWLVPGSRVFGRATFPSARLECLSQQTPRELLATETLLEQLQTPEAKILLEVKRDGRRVLLPVREGEEVRTTDPDYRVTVVRVFRNFTLDPRTGKAHDQGPRPFNPAVQALIEHEGRTRTAWLFSQLPEFSREAEDQHGIFRLVYPLTDHPHQRAEITVVDGGAGPSRVFVGRGGKLHRGDISPPGVVRLAGMTIGIPERVTNSRIDQTVRADPRGRPAVLVAWRRLAREGKRWIALGTEFELRSGDATFFAMLRAGSRGSKAASPHRGHGGGVPPPSLPSGHPAVGNQR